MLDSGDASAQLAIDLTDHTSRVVLMTTGKEPSVSPAVRSALRLSDVKVLTEAQPLELLGEGELERIRVHDLNEDEEYELTADAFVVLGVGRGGVPPARLACESDTGDWQTCSRGGQAHER